MKRKYAFIFALTITLIIMANTMVFSTISISKFEEVEISRIIDGDTLELDDGRKIRLVNINTPEKSRPHYEMAIEFLKKYEGKMVELEVMGSDRYNRVLGRIYTPIYLNLELVEEGLASKFLVIEEETKLFSKAEEKAIKESIGMWEKSNYFGCFETDIDAKNEKVIMINNCNNINIASWTMKDESRKTYEFKNINSKEVIIYTKEGEDNERTIFWNSNTNIWNDDRDTLYLFDEDGKIVHSHSYGY